MASPRIAILASGSGTTAESFIKSVAAKDVDGEVVLLICNNRKAAVFDRVKELNDKLGLNIKLLHIGKTNHPSEKGEKVEYGRQTEAEEAAILKAMDEMDIDLVLLLGYMKLIGKSIVDKYGWREEYQSIYQGRMLNTHPGLLPATKGLYGIHVQEKVLESGTEAGNCLFIVDSEYDDGPVISQHKVVMMASDTAEALFERVKASEKAHLAEDIDRFIKEQREYREKSRG
ncbi:MAG TPA: formyltransferase family protein [Candidatus Saccharimonadales bacterium]|nr:formyltransferase family protein [Candidatus Saccharimonadales bacterium]